MTPRRIRLARRQPPMPPAIIRFNFEPDRHVADVAKRVWREASRRREPIVIGPSVTVDRISR